MKSKKTIRYAWYAAFACVGCCALVPVLVMLGVTGAIGLSVYFEVAALGFFIVSLAVFSYAFFKNKQSKSCNDCTCEPGES